ncbi:MAG: DUF4140 domain-containing protein [Bacteroidota bacterium]
MTIRILFFYFFIVQAFAQPFKEKELKSTISHVTVFLQGAQITRTGEMMLPKGNTALIIKSLSPYIDEKSIQVEAE